MRILISQFVGSHSSAGVVEESIVDATKKTFTTYTRNINFAKLMSVEEEEEEGREGGGGRRGKEEEEEPGGEKEKAEGRRKGRGGGGGGGRGRDGVKGVE